MSATERTPDDILASALGHVLAAEEDLDTRAPAHDFTQEERETLAYLTHNLTGLGRALRGLRREVAARVAVEEEHPR